MFFLHASFCIILIRLQRLRISIKTDQKSLNYILIIAAFFPVLWMKACIYVLRNIFKMKDRCKFRFRGRFEVSHIVSISGDVNE